MTGPKVFAFYLYIFGGVRDIALLWAHPVADHTGADHICDKAITLAVPGEEQRTRTAPPIDFIDLVCGVRGEFNFILYDARGPEHTHGVNAALFS